MHIARKLSTFGVKLKKRAANPRMKYRHGNRKEEKIRQKQQEKNRISHKIVSILPDMMKYGILYQRQRDRERERVR